jgi:AcrR family transcriptional regulator
VDENLARRGPTRQEIITSACQLFLERGYHGASMRQIAQKAGIALGGIYNHFASKEAIFIAVMIEHYPILAIAPALQVAEGETIEELFHSAALLIDQALGQSPDFLNLMFIELVEFHGRHVPQLFETVYPKVLLFAQQFEKWQNELRPVPIPILMRAFIGLFFSYFMTDKLIGSLLPVEMKQDAFEYFVDIYLHGILAKGTPGTE